MPPRRGGPDVPARWRTQSISLQAILVDACWRPAEGEVAGDFHDVIDLKDGRVAVVIGDVAGFGPTAARSAETLRGELALAFRNTDRPTEALRVLDRRVQANGDEFFVTMACAVVNPETRTVSVANAGHPPILYADRLDARYVSGPVEPPLGMRAARTTVTYQLHGDAALFLYTDGLVERRRASLDANLDLLLDASRGLYGPLASAAEVARRATARLGSPTDDATVVSVRVLPDSVRRGGAPESVVGGRQQVVLRLYLDPRDLRSVRTESIVNQLTVRAPAYLAFKTEVVDITQPHADTEADGVLAAPTVVRVAPEPLIRVVGGLRSVHELARALQIPLEEDR